MKKRYYVAYGSNLNLDQMASRCPTAVPKWIATLPGYRLLFRGSKSGSYLTIEEAPGHQVPVVIWEVTSQDEERLDIYEGYPRFYYKANFQFQIGRKTKMAFAYLMHDHRPIGYPSARYIDTCLQGYRDFGLDESYFREALEYAKEVMKNEDH